MTEQADKGALIRKELSKLHSIKEMRQNVEAIMEKTGASQSLVYLEIKRQETTREEIAKALFSLFVVRSDTYAVQKEDKSYVRIEEPLTTDLIKGHLEGNITVGTYNLDKENMVKWGCIDIDEEAVDDPRETAKTIHKTLVENGFLKRAVVIEASRHPDPSYHVWILFKETYPAYIAKYLLERVLEKCNNPKVEIFPKQTRLEKDGFGNLVKLPLGLHQKSKKWSSLVDPETFKPLPFESVFEIDGTTLYESEIAEIKRRIEHEKPSYWFDRETEEKEAYRGDMPPCIQAISKGIEKGNRNESAIRLACFYSNFCKVKPSEALTSLREWNSKNKPSLDDREVEITLQSALRGRYNYGCNDPILKQFCNKEICPFTGKEGKLNENYNSPTFTGDTSTNEDVALYVMSLHYFKTMKDTGEIYYYKNGIYHPNGEALIQAIVERHYKNATIHVVNEVLGHIRRKTFVDRSEFDKEPYFLTLENGIVDIKTGLLNEFTPNYLSLIKIPLTYDSNALCPTIDKFLSEIVDPQDLETLYEIAGYCLIKRYFIHKAFMLNGDTHSGKSTYIKLLTSLIGKENVSNIPLQLLLTDKFSSSSLYGKLINSFADLPNSALRQTGIFKVLTGEDRISMQRKFKDSFTTENTAKLIFSCNEMPRTYDKGDAFFIRWIIINFPNRFDDKNPNTDKKLIDKLTTQQELSGFLNKALERARTLLKQEHFTVNPDVEDIRKYYEKLSNPIYAFIEEKMVFDKDGSVTKRDFYQELMKYCAEKRLTKPTQTFVTQELKRQQIEESFTTENKAIYRGLRLKTDIEMEKEKEKPLDDYS